MTMKRCVLLLLLCLAVHHTTAITASATTTTSPAASSSSPSSLRRTPRRHALPTLPIQARGGGAAVVKPKKTAAGADKDKKISLAYPILAAYLYNLRYVMWFLDLPAIQGDVVLPPNPPPARCLLTHPPTHTALASPSRSCPRSSTCSSTMEILR